MLTRKEDDAVGSTDGTALWSDRSYCEFCHRDLHGLSSASKHWHTGHELPSADTTLIGEADPRRDDPSFAPVSSLAMVALDVRTLVIPLQTTKDHAYVPTFYET